MKRLFTRVSIRETGSVIASLLQKDETVEERTNPPPTVIMAMLEKYLNLLLILGNNLSNKFKVQLWDANHYMEF